MSKTLSYSKGLLLLLSLTVTFLATAQKSQQQIEDARQKILSDHKVQSVSISSERQTPSLIRFKENQGIYKGEVKASLENYLAVRPGFDQLVPVKEVKLSAGAEVIEFQQFFRNVKVEYAAFKAFIRNGKAELMNGSWYEIPSSFRIHPSLTKESALQKAKNRVGARKYATDDIQEKLSRTADPKAKEILQKELEDASPKGELVIVKNFNKNGVAELRLAYKFDIYAAEPISRSWLYIDAQDGSLLLSDPIIKHISDNPSPTSTSQVTSVQTRYAGTQSIFVKKVSGNDPNARTPLISSHPATEPSYTPGAPTWVLIDDTRGNGVETYDLNGVGGVPISLPVYGQGRSFTDMDNNWTAAEHKRSAGVGGAFEAENDDIAFDAHWGAAMVYDYWKLKQNRLSYDGKNAKLRSFVHYGIAYDNAFWNGSVMTYGDGSHVSPSPRGFKALTSLDVCAHEIGHGVCTFTSNLVYEKESGAMNEGFSDIWAACAEYYVVKNVDPTLATKYKVFSIGEQIARDYNRPLRRMDSPQAEGDPDTYGGNFWTDPNCPVAPTLPNDYCGVHTNSGVLNKWFYLLTVGSHAGSGPDASFAGQDDGINDLGNAYSVTGVGFDVSEKIAYMTETMLTSTATFAEAREISINIAIALSGNACSELVKSVTNAWYAVGVGAAFVEPCIIRYGFIQQPGQHVTEGKSAYGCDAEHAVSVPVLLPANSTASITVSGTAANEIDYSLSTLSLSNTTAEKRIDSVLVYIINDANVEGDEYLNLKIALTNATGLTVNTNYRIDIIEDDVPLILKNEAKVLLNETFTRADGFEDPQGWKEKLEVLEDPNGQATAKGKNQWGIFNNMLAVTGKEGVTGVQLPPATYNNISISSTIIGSTLIDARELSSLHLQFDYIVQGEIQVEHVDPTSDPSTWPVYDFMSIVYSLDGVNWTELPYYFASVQPTVLTSFSKALPATLHNKQFYLGFRWYNDPLVGGPVSVAIDNLKLTGRYRNIENDLNDHASENLGGKHDVYFFSEKVDDNNLNGDVISRVQNNSKKNYGCTNQFIEKAGNGVFNLFSSNNNVVKAADKVVRMNSSKAVNGSNTISLYFTEDQLVGLENATGRNRSEFSIYYVDAPAYSNANAQNTKKATTTYTALPGIGGYFTSTINNKLSGSYALGVNTTSLTTQSTENSIMTEDGNYWRFHGIYPNPGNGNAFLSIDAPESRRVQVEAINNNGQVVLSQQLMLKAGRTQIPLQLGKLSAGSYMIRLRNEEGKTLHGQTYIKN